MTSASIIADVRAICSGNPPLNDISKVLRFHDCMYLMSKVQKHSMDCMKEYAINAASVHERFHNCAPIFSMLEKNNISYAVIKGATLSLAAYGGIGYRSSGDIDILISRSDIKHVKQILINAGFVQGHIVDGKIVPFTRQEIVFQTAMSHQLPIFLKSSNSPLCPYIIVDINVDVMWGESGYKTNMAEYLAYTENAEIYGVRFRKLTPEAEFVSLCLHHYKDSNSLYLLYNGNLKLKIFSDIYFYLKNNELDFHVLNSICNKFKVKEYVYWCIYNTNIIFNDMTTKKYMTLLYTDYAANILNTYGLTDSEYHIWSISLPERLFETNIRDYLNKVLSKNELEKIHLNSMYMR